MPTDDERREVARRLRKRAGKRVLNLGELLWCIGCDESDDAATWNRLADLIEPARGQGGRAILCAHCESVSWCGCEPGDEEGGCDFEPSVTEGEPPYNLYSLYEAVLRRHPRDEYAIEDDEVEELADALLDICNAPGHDVIQKPQPSCDRDALLEIANEMRCVADEDAPFALSAFSRRIREALGVES